MPILPSWNDTAAKQAITAFVARVTTEGGADYVPPNERIAVFDNDGTLWCELPVPVQAFFADDRLQAPSPRSIRSGRRPSRSSPSSRAT